MADHKIHLRQCKHNNQLAKALIDDEMFYDWGIIATFYSALHYANGALVAFGVVLPHECDSTSTMNHEIRKRKLLNNFGRPIAELYENLHVVCDRARYLNKTEQKYHRTPSLSYFSQDRAKSLYSNEFENFCRSVSEQLKQRKNIDFALK